jgi:hypothetical protein
MSMQHGYEFDEQGPYRRPDFGYEEMRGLASHPSVEFVSVTVSVPEGKTAWNPASTKRVLYGPVRIRYDVYREGIDATVLA